ncbi:uncharacterized protein LOC107267197 isoform X2 [Cephus cinctus]|uniref:Uncharacterized protein LOC107267197 isoform X2 n=1 Tax=Cephus cinctus TaxID=211228 RepID=A0AAJ7BTU5_CEPCN|nr:uncharacterized protein LOC107267197 isoform X2 [Cephus cinctus]
MRLSIGLLGLLLTALVAAAKEDKTDVKIKEAYADCAKELGMDMEKLKSRGFSQERDKEHDCLDACALRELGVMESGKLSKEVMVKMIEETIENEHEEKRTELLKITNACVDDGFSS